MRHWKLTLPLLAIAAIAAAPAPMQPERLERSAPAAIGLAGLQIAPLSLDLGQSYPDPSTSYGATLLRVQQPAPGDFRKQDHCGPEFIQSKLPNWLATEIQDAAAGEFRNVCRQHDACYRAQLGQKKCDDDMARGMAQVCSRQSWWTRGTCYFRARYLNYLLATSYGGTAYGGGIVSGEIVSIQDRRIRDRFSDDEIESCVTVRNNSPRTLEYDVVMYTWDGKRVDIEPDASERNIQSGQTSRFCVGTNFTPRWSRKDLGGNYKIEVRVDDPDSWSVTDDMLVVAKRQMPTP